MRVISQDGTIDIPYELSAVTIGHKVDLSKFNINIRSKLLDERPCIVATYSTEAKAIKAMEMLREHNEGVIFLKTIINTEKCTPFIRNLSKTDFDKLTQNYFQFPKDDEVKV